MNVNNTPSNANANIRSQLCFLNIHQYGSHASWQKITNLRKVLVNLLNALMHKKQNMKRINNLYQDIISIENLQLADIKARKNKKKIL